MFAESFAVTGARRMISTFGVIVVLITVLPEQII